jgi:hypothetical protein
MSEALKVGRFKSLFVLKYQGVLFRELLFRLRFLFMRNFFPSIVSLETSETEAIRAFQHAMVLPAMNRNPHFAYRARECLVKFL